MYQRAKVANMQVKTAFEVGISIRNARQAMGWTQSELAQRMGVTRQWVIRTEKGNDAAELALIMKAFAMLNVGVMVTPRWQINHNQNPPVQSNFDEFTNDILRKIDSLKE
ncbi:hypothetical protein AA14337_2908 [Acetobacter malorum DSM 14337]|uniref:HTH cro/C1-type domain-containing protein n=2 Tax=Acetobacter malorum TaxID=178901 RepID=A0ABQ0PYG2_9PROT|nr:hypothetical protein AD930_06725 [Acetobacter malorum]GBQ84767.1 hypothetical protein AA14337_2908 [Acetobacter malorum DSM 14337]